MKEKKEEEPKSALNIVLFPDKIVSNKSKLYSARISSKFDAEFILDRAHLPHITLYQGLYPDRNIADLISALTKLPAWNKDFEIVMDGFSVSHDTFLFWNALRSKKLHDLHESVVNAANGFREGNIAPNTIKMMEGLTVAEQEMVKKTGSILNFEMFNPHITISRLKNASDSQQALEYLGGSEWATFKPESIHIAKLGDHGTVSESIEEIFYR